jgi:uncharacterized membrane protein
MGAVKDMYYDVETLFIEGHTATEIAAELKIPIEYVHDVLSDFGVDPEDFDDAVDTQQGDYYGA